MFKARSGVRTFSASRNASTSSAKSSKAMAWWGEMGWFDQQKHNRTNKCKVK